mgnify:CR=1 FL=1
MTLSKCKIVDLPKITDPRGKLTFILLEQIGKAVIVNDVDPSKVRDFLHEKLSG